MHTKCNGHKYSPENFTGLHQSSFVILNESYDHVNFQIPTEHSIFGFLIDNISNNDLDLHDKIASVQIIKKIIINGFESDASLLLPACPYDDQRASIKHK